MKLLKYITGCLSVVMLFSSCQKAIDLNLNTAPSDYVIEGVVTNEAGGTQVLISRTKSFTDDNSFNGVSGAEVTISANGTSYALTESAKGIYRQDLLAGTPGSTYNLSVKVNGKNYSSICTMPKAVALDSIYVVQDKIDLNKDKQPRRFITVKYKDPAGEKNYYRFVQYLNNVQEKTVFVDNDEFTDGQTVNSILRYSNSNDDVTKDLKTGDQVTIAMLTISQPVYQYWYSLNSSATGDGNNAAPSNPVTNIKGGALGYFSAHTIQRKSLTVQ